MPPTNSLRAVETGPSEDPQPPGRRVSAGLPPLHRYSSGVKETISKFMRRPWVAHILAALERFGKRLGPQFAGAITYFSVLSMIPVLLFGLAVLGFVVTVFRPDLLVDVQNFLNEQLRATADVAGEGKDNQKFVESITTFVTDAFKGWRSAFGISILAAAYSGSNWVKNLKHAVRAMWKDSFAEAAKKGSFVGELLTNLVIFFGLLLSIAVAVGVTAAGQAFPQEIISWLGAENIPGISLLVWLAGVAVSLVASWLLFAFLFTVLPGERTKKGTFIRGTLAGAILLTVLQQVAGVVVGLLSGNASAGVFGPIIILMIVFNLLATIILMISAWVGTADTWEADRAKKEAVAAAGGGEKDETGIDDDDEDEPLGMSAPTVASRRRAERWAATRNPDDLRAVNYDPETVAVEDPHATVTQDVAARSVRLGMGLGYGVGAATGVGLGAIIAALVGKLSRR